MSTAESETLRIQQAERADIKARGPIIARILKDTLQGTAWVENRPFTEFDIERGRETLFLAAPYAHPRVYPNLWEHMIYSSILARNLAEKVNMHELPPLEAEGLELLDDYGSIGVPHRYYRKNIVSHLLDKYFGVRPELRDKRPSVPHILGRDKPIKSVEDVSLPQAILDVADNLGKLDQNGLPWRMEAWLESVSAQPQRYAGGVWASERYGLKALTQGGKQEFAIKLLLDEVELLKIKFGVNIDKAIDVAFAEFMQTRNQEWLREIKQAQETLNPEVDEQLGRPPIRAVVFDVGGVLMKDADPALIQVLASYFECSTELIVSLFNSLDTQAMSGRINGEEYLRQFWQGVGKDSPKSLEEARKPFIHPEIYHAKEGIQDIVNRLSQNSQVQVFVLSDSIPAETPTVVSWLTHNYPTIKKAHIFISHCIGAAKGEQGSPAFKVLLEKLSNADPQEVLFIDDNSTYTTTARSRYNLRSMHFRENDPERLGQELEKACLI